MAVLPIRRRKSRAQRALETAQSALKVYTSLKVAQAGPKAAKAVAKGYTGAKAAKGGAKVARVLLIPAVLAGLAAALLRMRRGARVAGPGTTEPAASPGSPVSTGMNAPAPGEPGAPKSSTSTASPGGAGEPGEPGGPGVQSAA